MWIVCLLWWWRFTISILLMLLFHLFSFPLNRNAFYQESCRWRGRRFCTWTATPTTELRAPPSRLWRMWVDAAGCATQGRPIGWNVMRTRTADSGIYKHHKYLHNRNYYLYSPFKNSIYITCVCVSIYIYIYIIYASVCMYIYIIHIHIYPCVCMYIYIRAVNRFKKMN